MKQILLLEDDEGLNRGISLKLKKKVMKFFLLLPSKRQGSF